MPSSPWRRLLMALLIVAVASAFRMAFFGSLGRGIPFLIYYPAVTLAALYGGLLTGLLSTVLSAGMVCFWINQGQLSSPEWLAMAVFVGSGVLVSCICEVMHRSFAREKQSRKETEAANKQLLGEIAERSQAQEKLQAVSYRLFLATHAAGVGIWDYDVEANRLVWDDQMFRLYGITGEQFAGAYQAWQAGLHPEDRQRCDDEIQAALRGEKDFDTEFRVLWPDGSTHYIRAIAVVERDATGKVVRMIGTNWDITERQRAETALREKNEALILANTNLSRNEQKLRGLYELCPLGIALTDMQGRYIEFNEAFRAICGYPAEELKQLDYWKLTPNIYEQDEERQIESLRNTGRYGPYEKHYRRNDGTLIPISLNGMLITDAAGYSMIWSIVEDITERKRTEEVNARLVSIVASSQDAIIGKDLDGIINFWNPGAEKMFGYAAGEMIGTSIRRLIPADQKAEEDSILERIRRGETLEPFETLRQTKDGRLLDVSVMASPVRNSAGQVIGVSKTVRDITVIKMHELEALRISRLYQALSQINQAIVWSRSRAELLDKVCRALVEFAGFRMAWIGRPEAETHKVKPIAQWGDTTNYLSQALIYADDQPEGYGPTGMAIRTETKLVFNDFMNEPRTRPWRKLAEVAGFRSSAGFPIREGGAVCGAITVYSGVVGYFRDKEVGLLEEAAINISFALDNFAQEEERKRIEMALRNSQAWLEEAQDIANMGSYVYDIALDRWSSSKKMLEIFGIDQTYERSMAGWSALIHPEDRSMMTDYFIQEVLGKGRPFNKEYRIIRHDDHTEHWVLGIGKLEYDGQGRPEKMVGMIQDITVRKQAADALQASVEKYRSLNTSMTEGMALHELVCDASGKPVDYVLLDVNPAFESVTGLRGEAVVGRRGSEVYGGEAPFLEEYAEVATTGQPLQFEKTYAPMKKTFMISAFSPAKGLFATVFSDITERKQAEASLARLEMAIEQAAEAIVITDTAANILYANPAFEKTTGYTRAEALGQNPRMLKSGKHDDAFYRQMWDTLNRGEVWNGHFINKRKDGRLFEEEAVISPVRDAAGKVVNYVAVKRDVTHEVELEAQFRQSQKMQAIGTLAGGVAHDFNNMLGVISMQAGLLKTGDLSAEQREFANEIGVTVNRAAALTRQLLLFSRHEMVQPHDLDLNASIGDLSKMLQRMLGETIEVEIKLAAQPMFIHGDPSMMDQVLMNLAVNARDAMLKGGRLAIETSGVEFDEFAAAQAVPARPGSFVCLSVSDSGDGIPPEVLPRIFEPFFTTKGVGKGTGLGLATVFGIVQQHKGWINVYSEVGRGTTFRIYLPRLTRMTDKKVGQKMQVAVPAGKETILLVEDEPALRLSIRRALTQLGYRILEAPTGVKALEVWQEHRDEIQLLLTDMIMPDSMTGKELAQRLLREKPKLKVVYMSGYSPDFVEKDFPAKEGVNFIAKPFQAQKLAQIIRDRLD